ncbi:hypothetical protein JTB14_035378 [Gonioctena quinquepunctata]|nr:hypothetical protein JTB14_035378 [Gonioctena quinquepunctata]
MMDIVQWFLNLPDLDVHVKLIFSYIQCIGLSPEKLAERIVDHIDIAYDEVSAKHYKEEEDPRFFQSKKTHRGPLIDGWRTNHHPIMCSYKLVHASFEVFGLQTRVEDFIHSCIREVLLLGHRQAFAWIDDWIEMTMEDVRKYETELQQQTNSLLKENTDPTTPRQVSDGGDNSLHSPTDTPKSPKSPEKKGYFSNWF